jgi:hypothetical protein
LHPKWVRGKRGAGAGWNGEINARIVPALRREALH